MIGRDVTARRSVAGLPGALVLLVLLATPARGADAPDGFVLRVARVFDGKRVIENGVIVVRDGTVVAIGPAAGDDRVEIPPGLAVIDEPDSWAMPGLVAAASELAGQHGGDESVGAGYRAVDAFNPFANHARALAAGVTTAHIDPGTHRLLTGQGAVVKLGGEAGRRVLHHTADICVQLGDPADSPPRKVKYPFPASSDVAIEPAEIQGPTTRMGRVIDLERAIDAAIRESANGAFDFHRHELARLWTAGTPLRIGADRAVDIRGAARFLRERGQAGSIVGGAEARAVLDALGDLPVVYRPRTSFRGPAPDIGLDPDSIQTDLRDVVALPRAALAIPPGGSLEDLRLVAIAAHGAGVPAERALASITSTAAEILGVGERVGTLTPGHDADILVMTGDPLDPRTQVKRVYVDGHSAWEVPSSRALVVRAGAIWAGSGRVIEDGEVLIEDGKVVAVGTAVPRPPFARVVNAGPGAFVTPGFIDARGHLDLAGDRTSAGTDADLTRIVGVPGAPHRRVARAGITTTILSPYSVSSTGARLTAVKTTGRSRADRVVRPTTAVAFRIPSSQDPLNVTSSIESVISRGKKYLDAWKKYEKELAEYLERQKKGEAEDGKPVVTEEVEEKKPDPVTGTWEGTASGGPIEGSVSGKAALRLDGKEITGRIIEPEPPLDHTIVGTLEGTKITGYIDVDTGGLGVPRFEAELVGEDAVRGTLSVAEIVVNFEGRRIDKAEVEFSVTRRRTAKGGKPTPPKVDPALEPIKDLLEQKIPAVVEVSTPKQIEGILDLFLEKHKLPLVLVDAEGAFVHAGRLAEKQVGVVLGHPLVSRRRDRDFNLGDVLSRSRVALAFQSNAGDGARDLPLNVLRSVTRGLSADAALAAFTTDAAKMFKVEDRVGSLEPGRDGDLVIFSAHPFREGGRVLRVFINGEEVR